MSAGCQHFRFSRSDPDAGLGLGMAALRYIRMGYAVLPLSAGGKRPHQMLGGEGGVHRASLMEPDVRRWWAEDPAANVGVACGIVSRLCVIDLDVKHEHSGPSALGDFLSSRRLELTDGYLGIPFADTPSGGMHLWLRSAAGVAVPERPGILPGVDVKGNGGYVAAPPSMLSVRGISRPGEQDSPAVPVPYRWRHGCCPCSAPQWPGWMPGWLASAAAAGTGRADGGGSQPDPDRITREGAPRGERNVSFYRLACSLYGRHGTGPEGLAAAALVMREAWEATDRDGFGWGEVEGIMASARKFVSSAREAEMGVAERDREGLIAWRQEN